MSNDNGNDDDDDPKVGGVGGGDGAGGDGGDEEDEFLLFESGVIEKIKVRPVFQKAIVQFIQRTAEVFGCHVTLSARRLDEAHDFWIGDVKRTLNTATTEDTTELDHFKHAAFIAFWLRRLVPINDIYFLNESRVPSAAGADNTAPTDAQINFYRFGNELCALCVGFYICLAYETYAMAMREASDSTPVIYDGVGVKALPSNFLWEYPGLLKHKNVSPHGMYMLYRSLFDRLDWDVGERRSA